MEFIEKYQQEDFREFKAKDSRFYIKFGYRPNGEFRLRVETKNLEVFTYESDGFYTNKKKGRKFGKAKEGWIELDVHPKTGELLILKK
jgi:hypothetical protein